MSSISALASADARGTEKHVAASKPAQVQQETLGWNKDDAGFYTVNPIQYNQPHPEDELVEAQLAINKANIGGQVYQTPADARKLAEYYKHKKEVLDLTETHHLLLNMYDLSDLNTRRHFDSKFPFIKQLKMKRLREVADMHFRLASILENSNPTMEETKYIIDLALGRAKLPPPLFPERINKAIAKRGNIDLETQYGAFQKGLLNPTKMLKPGSKLEQEAVDVLGTNVFGKGWKERIDAYKTYSPEYGTAGTTLAGFIQKMGDEQADPKGFTYPSTVPQVQQQQQ
jgi:hypothetical protein